MTEKEKFDNRMHDFRMNFYKIEKCKKTQAVIESESKETWRKLGKDKMSTSHFDNVFKESIQVPKSTIDVDYPLYLVTTKDDDGFIMRSELCMHAKITMSRRVLINNKKNKKDKFKISR